MANLVELFDNIVQMQNLNGVPLAAGKLYVYALGRTRLMDSWSDVDGESLNPNPIILDDAGQAHVYVSDDFDYTLVVCDQYNNEIFSLDKYLFSEGSHSHADVAVAPSEHIGVSSYHVGEVTVYVPYLTGEVGKVYEGIDPIVVNNDVNRISANHIPLGVQDPLYFVEDSETACIIGCSAQTEIPAELSGKWDNASDVVIANSAQWSEDTTYEAGSYIDIDGHTISVTGLQPEGDYAYNSALSSKLDVTALPQDLVHSGDLTAYQAAGNYLSATDSAKFYPINNPSGFITGVDLTDYATTAQLDEKLDKSDSGNFYPMEGNPSGFLTAHQSLQGYATEDWVTGQGYLTAHQSLDGLMSADLLEISDNKITGYNGTAFAGQGGATGDFELSAGSGISIVDYPLEQKTVISVTAQGGNTAAEQAVIDNSATWNNVSAKLDTTAFSDVSGTFLTAHQDLSDYQTIAGMTAYQEAGNYLSANALDELSGNWETVTAKQDSLTFGYHDTAISSIDNSALYDNSAHARINTLAGRISDLSSNKLDTTAFSDVSGTFLTAHQDLSDYQTTAGMTAYQPIGDYVQGSDLSLNSYDKISAISGHEIAGGGGGSVDFDYDSDGNISGINSSAISDSRAGTPLYVESPLFTGQSGDSAYIGVSGYVWQSALLFHTDTPITQTTYTLSDNCSNYDRLDVDFYDINNWRTVMECSIPSNLDASGTRGGYFSVVPASTATGAAVWFKAFNWTAANTTWSCYCSEIAAQGGSTTQTVNANQPENPPKVVNIIGWKRVGV